MQIPTIPQIYNKTRVINNSNAILALQLDDRFPMREKRLIKDSEFYKQ